MPRLTFVTPAALQHREAMPRAPGARVTGVVAGIAFVERDDPILLDDRPRDVSNDSRGLIASKLDRASHAIMCTDPVQGHESWRRKLDIARLAGE